MGWEKIVDILSWLKDKLPIADRLEKIKNDITKLENEKNTILVSKANVKKAKRLAWINSQLYILNRRLQNASNSS